MSAAMNTITYFLLFTLCILQITSVVTTRFCNHFYHATKEGNCIPCNHTCEPGKILEQNCGYDAHGNRIPGKSMCKKCQQNEYSANSRTCLPCKECKDRQFKRRCTETADAICEDCPAGYHSNDKDICVPLTHIGTTVTTTATTTVATVKSVLSTKNGTTTKQLVRSTVMNTSTLPITKSSVQRYHSSEPLIQSTNRVLPATSLGPHSTTVTRSGGDYTAQSTAGLQLHTRISTRIETISKNHLGRSLLLIAVLSGVVIVVMLVVILTKSMKSKGNQPKPTQMNFEDIESNRTPLTVESTKEADEYDGDEDGDEDRKAKDEAVVSDSQYFNPDLGGELKAEPFLLGSDDASHNYFSVLDQPIVKCDEGSRRARNFEQDCHNFSFTRMDGFLNGGGSLNKGYSSYGSDGRRSQQASKRCRNQRAIFCHRCKQISNPEHPDFGRKLDDIKECEKKTLKDKLDLETEGTNSWKEVATYFSISQDTIRLWISKIKAGESPTESVIYCLGTQNVTIAELLSCLDKLKRYDARDALLNHLQEKCCICKTDFVLTSNIFN